jgi:hypothetical protein
MDEDGFYGYCVFFCCVPNFGRAYQRLRSEGWELRWAIFVWVLWVLYLAFSLLLACSFSCVYWCFCILIAGAFNAKPSLELRTG